MKEKEEKVLAEAREKHYVGKTNVADYGVPAGVQLTENLNEEIAESAPENNEE